jgi:hypothetical protein
MAVVPYTSIGDLITGTLNDLPKTYSETMRQVQYPLCRLFYTTYKQSTGGIGYEKKIRKAAKTTFQRVLPYQATATQHEDLLVKQVTPYVFYEQKLEWDERVMKMNSGAEQIIDMMKVERSGGYEDIYNNLEDDLAQAPTNATDPMTPYGLQYWFPTLDLNSTDPTGGFNGKKILFRDGTSSTTRAGVDLSLAANARLRSFAGTYSGYADEPFFDLLRRAMTRTDFGTLAHLEGEKPSGSSPGDMYLLASHDMCDQIAKRVNKGPDDQNGDTEKFKDGQFRGVGFIRSPNFDNFAYNPVYGIKRSKTFGIILKGEWMRETPAQNSPASLLTWVVGIVGSHNLTCDDPRSGGFCLHTVRTAN